MERNGKRKTDIVIFNYRKNVTYAKYVMKGVSAEGLEDNRCKYFGIRDLTTQPRASYESCNFYMSRLEQNGSDIVVNSCTSQDLLFDKR